jgi:hypothetical protein
MYHAGLWNLGIQGHEAGRARAKNGTRIGCEVAIFYHFSGILFLVDAISAATTIRRSLIEIEVN